jgi:hypothetical protein
MPIVVNWRTINTPSQRGRLLYHANLASEVYKFCLRQRLGENVHNFIICGYVLEIYCSLLYHVLDEVTFDISMLRLVMKYWIFQNIDTTLIITVY